MEYYDNNIWLDEVGRWPLAGPVTVGGVFVLPEFWDSFPNWAHDITDSKVLTAHQRRSLADSLQSDKAILWSIHSSSPQIIDTHWIIEALRRASVRVIDDLLRQLTLLWCDPVNIVLDGNHEFGLRNTFFRWNGTPRQLANKSYRQSIKSLQTLIKWDDKVWQIAAASVIAKAHRDEYMISLSKKRKYRYYGFERHKWYGTKLHREMIIKYWNSDIHRSSYSYFRS